MGETDGGFRYTREILFHHTEDGDAARLVGLLFSQGHVMTLLKGGFSEDELGITRFRDVAMRRLGMEAQTWYFSSRLRFGIV